MNIEQASQLPDDTSIDEITLTVNKINPPKLASTAHPEYGREWFCQAFDATGKIGLIFKYKKAENNPEKWQGQTITIKTSHNREGAMTGIKLKHREQYRNIYVTDSAKITVAGGASSQPVSSPSNGGNQSVSQPASYRAKPPSPQTAGMSPEEYAKHCATCWCQVYDWTAEIFKSRLGEDALVRECVTSVVITMQRDNIAILPFTDRPYDWKNVSFRDKKLSEYTPAQLQAGYVLSLQGKFQKEELIKGFSAAFDSLNLTHKSVYGFILNKEGIEDDTADTILLRDMKTPEEMTDDEYKAVLSSAKFFEDAKALQASKITAFDDSTTSLD